MTESLRRVHPMLIGVQVDGQENQFLQALDSLIVDNSTDIRTAESSQTEPPPTGESSDLPWHSGHVIRPTWKVVKSRLEPPTIHIVTPPAPDRHVTLLVRESFHGARNTFGLLHTYKGVPSSIPDQPNGSDWIPSYQHPTTP